MAIFNRCKSCKTFNSVKNTRCKKCGEKLGKNYYIQYSVNGRRKTEAIGSSITQAKEILNKIKTQIKENKYFEMKDKENNNITWKEFFDKYYLPYVEKNIRSFKENKCRYFTARNYKGFDKPLKEISKKDINDFILHLQDGSRSNSTINRYLAVVKRALSFAEELELIEYSPAKKIKDLKETPKPRRALSFEEENRLLKACKESGSKYLYYVVKIALYTGMRYSEILNLEWRYINFDFGYMRIYDTKNGDYRDVPISKKIRDLLLELYEKTGHMKYVFENPFTGKPVGNLRWAFMRAIKRAGIKDFSFHGLRHTFCTRAGMAGLSTHQIKQLSGHKTDAIVSRYTHLGLQNAIESMSKLDDFLDNVSNKDKVVNIQKDNKSFLKKVDS